MNFEKRLQNFCGGCAELEPADELNVTLSVYRGMPHDFAMLLPELDESVKSFAEIKNFVNVNMPKPKKNNSVEKFLTEVIEL